MATAKAIPNTAFPDVVLKLNPQEARALAEYLGVHSTMSSVDTYGIFSALTDALDGYPSPKRSFEIMDRVTVSSHGLVVIESDER